MEPSTPVKVVEVCKVAPPPSSAEFTLPLTFFDLFSLRFPPTQRLFFYELAPHPNSTSTFYQVILPKLKHSLSITLQHYLPLAGNLVWNPSSDKPILHFINGDDGISLTVAESHADFDQLSSINFRISKEFYHLLPNFPATDAKVPLLTLQLTLFPNRGFSIGCVAHHAATDGKTISMFMHSWASICRDSGLTPELTPIYDRTIVKDPAGFEEAYLKIWLERNGPGNKSLMYMDLEAPSDIMLGIFRFTSQDIDKLKKKVLAQLEKKNNHKLDLCISTFTVVNAYTWVCLVESQKVETQKVHLAMGIDCRDGSGSDPPIPWNYFGNCIVAHMVDAETEELKGEGGVGIAALVICEGLKRFNDGVGKKDVNSTSAVLFPIPKGKLYSTGGYPNFVHYSIDFGWGRPCKVKLISIDKSGAFSLSDSREDTNGIEIGVALKKHEAEAFASRFHGGLRS